MHTKEGIETEIWDISQLVFLEAPFQVQSRSTWTAEHFPLDYKHVKRGWTEERQKIQVKIRAHKERLHPGK